MAGNDCFDMASEIREERLECATEKGELVKALQSIATLAAVYLADSGTGKKIAEIAHAALSKAGAL